MNARTRCADGPIYGQRGPCCDPLTHTGQVDIGDGYAHAWVVCGSARGTRRTRLTAPLGSKGSADRRADAVAHE
eukprot:1055589-Prymnesium_polylepis.1